MAARPRHALLLGAILLAAGCQTSQSLTRWLSQPKSAESQSALAVLDQSREEAGLPPATKSKSKGDSLTRLLDRAQDSLADYYEDSNPTHLKDARRSYEQALAEEAGNPESHHGLAIVCDLQKDYSSAELHYQAALESDPENGKVLGDLGYSYLLQNRLSDSESILIQATKRDPGNTQAVKNLAYVYAKQGNYNLADSTFRKVMDDLDVRQEMAQLFPNGRPDMAESGERSKLPWRGNNALTTNEVKVRMENARDQSETDLRDRQTALDRATAPTLTIDELKAEVARLEWERDQAERLRVAHAEQSANTPLVLDYPSPVQNQAVPRMQIQPQTGSHHGNEQQFAGTQPPAATIQPSPYQGGRRVLNGFYPEGSPSQPGQNRSDIEQAGAQNQPLGPNSRRPVDQAYHQTNQGIDPRTGRPFNSVIQQTQGQQPLIVPNGIGGSDQGAAAPERVATFEDAKRRAAMAGLGGPEMMFPMPTLEGTQRMAPGSGSSWGGNGFSPPQRMLPMDMAPHDLQKLMEAPSGQYTVQPNNSGMLNSPSGPSFSNQNTNQRLAPQISIESPMGHQGMTYQDQANSAQPPNPRQQPGQYQQYQPTPTNEMSITPRPQGYSDPNYDSRNHVNSDLNQYNQLLQHNPAQNHESSWTQTPTPAYGVPNQPQVDSPNQLMAPAWNQQQLTPRMTPPPYQSRPGQTGYEQSSVPGDSGTSFSNSNTRSSEADSSRSTTTGATYPGPSAIYSPGARVPQAYGNGNRVSNSYGQSNSNGPRIIPSGR